MTYPKDALFTENNIIDPFWVIRYLENNLPKDQITAELLQLTLKKMVRVIKGVKVTFYKSRSAKNVFIINGFFDKDQRKSIEVQICSSGFKKKLLINKKFRNLLINEIADTLCHESIHRYQYQYKDFGRDATGFPDQTYYGDPDEMFCFSVNIAHNLYRQYGPNSLEKLKNVQKILRYEPYLSEYYSLFYNQKEYKKVLKMVYLNLLAIDQGKILHRDLCQL